MEARLKALAEEEIRELGRVPVPVDDQPVDRLLRLQADARALFIAGRDVADAQAVLNRYLETWTSWVRSDQPWTLRLGAIGPQSSESLMSAYDVLLTGLWAVIAAADAPRLTECRPRFLSQRPPPETDLGVGAMIEARQLCLLVGDEFDRAGREIDESWTDWVDLDLVHADDTRWIGMRGLASNYGQAVKDSVRLLGRQRRTALEHAASSPHMLRSTLPARLALDAERAALIRLAAARGMTLDPSPPMDGRVAALWHLPPA